MPGSASLCPPGGNDAPPATDSIETFARFCDILEKVCGIKLGGDKGYLVASRLGAILRDTRCRDLGQLVTLLERPDHAARELRNRVVDAMTTNETLWFRDDHPFAVLKQAALPELAASSRIRIWSAACSTGQEPYSISMCVEELKRERPGLLRGTVEVVGTDISSSALQAARDGLYAEHTLRRGLSERRRRSHFVDIPGGCQPRQEVRQRVQFHELNLLGNFSLLGRFEIIFCRNVLIYFSTERRTDILKRMVASLQPGGWLFLGGTESVPAEVKGIEQHRQSRGFVYRKL